jgi:medium-chain acyl-[acyl-carrier-protein] hydrolase
MDTVKLYCLPYAGGSASIFTGFRRYLHPRIELCPIELAGRGQRQQVPLYRSLQDAVDDVVQLMGRQDQAAPFCLFGHSLGGLLAYESCRRLQLTGQPLPVHLFVSGKQAPHIAGKDEAIHQLPDAEFIRQVVQIGGTPPEIFQNRELTDYVLPILRADFRIAKEYRFEPAEQTLKCDMTILGGDRDELTVFDLAEWKKHTTGKVVVRMLSGGHLFINDNIATIAAIINETVAQNIR